MKRASAWSIRIWSLLFVVVALGWWWVTRTHAGSWWWAAALNMVPPQLLWLWPLLLAWQAARGKKRGWVILNLLTVAVFTVSVVGFVLPKASRSAGPGLPVGLMTINADYATAPPARLAELALREGVQVITVQEALDRRRSGQAFEAEVRAAFPGWNVVRRDELLTVSHFPVLSQQVVTFPHSPHSVLVTQLRVEGETLTVVNVHLPTFPLPRDGTFPQRTERQLSLRRDFQAVVTGILQRYSGPLVLAGDLNTPARGGVVNQLRYLGLTDAFAQAGAGFGFTHWAYLGHSRPDYVWLRDIQAERAAPLRDIVSDHRALVAHLRLPDTSAPASTP